jgi:hypothetical protein
MVGETEPHTYTATIGVFSESMSLAELTTALGPPTHGHDLGQPRSRRLPDGPKKRNSGWFLEAACGDDELRGLSDQITELVIFLEAHVDQFVKLGERVTRDIWCGVYSGQDAQGGFNLEPALLRRLGDLDLPVIFDLY